MSVNNFDKMKHAYDTTKSLFEHDDKIIWQAFYISIAIQALLCSILNLTKNLENNEFIFFTGVLGIFFSFTFLILISRRLTHVNLFLYLMEILEKDMYGEEFKFKGPVSFLKTKIQWTTGNKISDEIAFPFSLKIYQRFGTFKRFIRITYYGIILFWSFVISLFVWNIGIQNFLYLIIILIVGILEGVSLFQYLKKKTNTK